MERDKIPTEVAASQRSKSTSVSCESVTLEEGTSIRTTGFSRGFVDGRFLYRNAVPCVPVTGTQIKNHSGLVSCVTKYLQTYYVKRVLSPFEFYLERESDAKIEETKRHEKMQVYYEREEGEAIEVSKMKCYAYYDPHSKSWWRVRVQDFEIDGGINRAYVYYCDTGKQEYVLCESLRQLYQEFQGVWDCVILKCYLQDVLPVSGDLHWSIEAIAYFKELISNQRLGAVVLKGSTKPVVEHSPDMTIDCGVVLTEKVNPDERPDSINWLMVKMGFARSIGIMSSSPGILDIQGLVPSFYIPETTEEPTLEKCKQREISLEELRIITTKAMNSFRPEQRYCPVYHERPTNAVSDPDHYIPFNIRVRLAWVRISFVVGPNKIFVHTRNKKLELRAMEAEMKKICTKLPQPVLESLQPGSVITCDMKDRKHPDKDSWCRAVVLSIDLPKQAVTVLLVDYGIIMKIHASVLYQITDKYRSIPSFVHRVHLSDIKPNYDVPHWHETINNVFFKYIISHEPDLPLYYVHLPDHLDILKFTDINQGLYFSDLTNKWMVDCPQPAEENATINSMRNDPLLASYFCSRPVQIYYEVAVDQLQFWKCANLSEYFIKREYAKFVKPQLDKDKIHQILKNGFGSL